MTKKSIREEYVDMKFKKEFTELLEEVTKLRIAIEQMRRAQVDCSDWYWNHG